MKDGIKEIVGKQISGVVIAENPKRQPTHQIFLIFSDGTHFEMYGDQFTCAGGIDRGANDEIARYVMANGGEITATYS